MEFRKAIVFLLVLTLLAFTTEANAIDFKIGGLWQFGFGVNETSLADKAGGHKVKRAISDDTFKARQRLRIWLNAVASENLSGTVQFEIGHQRWGQASSGAALGADSDKVIKLRQAYIDWMMPETDVKVRMGIQNVTLPTTAGGSSIMDDQDVAAVTVSWLPQESFGLTAMWARPYNDNFLGTNGRNAGYLDNFDLFLLSVPLKTDFMEITPWAMYGFKGVNTFREPRADGGYTYTFQGNSGGNLVGSLGSVPFGNVNQQHNTSRPYGSLFWAGLPITLTLDEWNIEFEASYGFVQGMGDYTVRKSRYGSYYGEERASTQREGWLLKALAEYKFDWGKPGVFGWYGSGDDGSLKNGSERLPFLYAETRLTSIFGDAAALYGGIGGNDRSQSFDGTWGVGAQIKDLSFFPKVSHLLRATWVGGTNSPSMVKYAKFLSDGVYADPAIAWQGVPNTMDFYLTTQDNLLELNFHTIYDMYENFRVGLEFGYVVNMIDKDLWKRADNTTFSKTDIWLVDLKFAYRF